jgi:hypothetical protein
VNAAPAFAVILIISDRVAALAEETVRPLALKSNRRNVRIEPARGV